MPVTEGQGKFGYHKKRISRDMKDITSGQQFMNTDLHQFSTGPRKDDSARSSQKEYLANLDFEGHEFLE